MEWFGRWKQPCKGRFLKLLFTCSQTETPCSLHIYPLLTHPQKIDCIFIPVIQSRFFIFYFPTDQKCRILESVWKRIGSALRHFLLLLSSILLLLLQYQ